MAKIPISRLNSAPKEYKANEFNQLNIYVGIDKNSIIYELNTFIEKQ